MNMASRVDQAMRGKGRGEDKRGPRKRQEGAIKTKRTPGPNDRVI